MIKTIYYIALVAGISFFTLKAEKFTCSTPADWDQSAKLRKTAPGKMQIKLAGRIISVKKCTFEPGKTYYITGAVKAAVGSAPGSILLGLRLYDRAGEYIPMCCICYVEGSDTEILEATEPTDRTIVVKDASKWSTAAHMVLALDTKPDRTDLPNRNILGIAPSKIEKKNGKWLIHLRKPIGTVLSAGTKIREHFNAGEFYIGIGSDRKPIIKNSYRLLLRKGSAKAELLIHATPAKKGEKMLLEIDDFSIFAGK